MIIQCSHQICTHNRITSWHFVSFRSFMSAFRPSKALYFLNISINFIKVLNISLKVNNFHQSTKKSHHLMTFLLLFTGYREQPINQLKISICSKSLLNVATKSATQHFTLRECVNIYFSLAVAVGVRNRYLNPLSLICLFICLLSIAHQKSNANK